jgi:hypothetical protein
MYIMAAQLHGVYKSRHVCTCPLIFVGSGFVQMLTAATTIELLGMLFSMQPITGNKFLLYSIEN